tara:strand:+ start:2346 stop:2633 length:288 start_codon:yes stop_codon:yes gene_type:complete
VIVITQTTSQRTLTSLEFFVTSLAINPISIQIMSTMSEYDRQRKEERDELAEQAYEEYKLNKALDAARLEYLEDHDWDGSSLNQIPTILEDEGTN